jgi:hypothetical protein
MNDNKLENLLAENMRRFSTKNLNEQDVDQNDNGYPDKKEDSTWNPMSEIGNVDFMRDVKQEKANFQWVSNIATAAVKLQPILLRILKKIGYTDPRTFTEGFGFEIRQTYGGPLGYRGYIFVNLVTQEQDLKKINADPEFTKYFQKIQFNWGTATNLANSKLPIAVEMKATPLPQ